MKLKYERIDTRVRCKIPNQCGIYKCKVVWKIKILFSLIILLGATNSAFTQNALTNPTLQVDSSKKVYKLGEVIKFSFSLENTTDETIIFLDQFGTGSGFLHLFISENGGDFKVFQNPRWGIRDVDNVKTILKLNEKTEASGTLFWTWLKQDIPGYIFVKPGVYQVKATYNISIEGRNSTILESAPIQIVIEEPVGDDLNVWNKIKTNGNFAYFIEEGAIRIPTYKPKERAEFLKEVEQLLADYPNSFFAESLRESLAKSNAAEIRSQEIKRKKQRRN